MHKSRLLVSGVLAGVITVATIALLLSHALDTSHPSATYLNGVMVISPTPQCPGPVHEPLGVSAITPRNDCTHPSRCRTCLTTSMRTPSATAYAEHWAAQSHQGTLHHQCPGQPAPARSVDWSARGRARLFRGDVWHLPVLLPDAEQTRQQHAYRYDAQHLRCAYWQPHCEWRLTAVAVATGAGIARR